MGILDHLFGNIQSEKASDFPTRNLFSAEPVCAHNAQFDCSFLSMTLSRLGYDASIRYADTLMLSRTYLNGLPNYRQGTIANRLAIPTVQAPVPVTTRKSVAGSCVI